MNFTTDDLGDWIRAFLNNGEYVLAAETAHALKYFTKGDTVGHDLILNSLYIEYIMNERKMQPQPPSFNTLFLPSFINEEEVESIIHTQDTEVLSIIKEYRRGDLIGITIRKCDVNES